MVEEEIPPDERPATYQLKNQRPSMKSRKSLQYSVDCLGALRKFVESPPEGIVFARNGQRSPIHGIPFMYGLRRMYFVHGRHKIRWEVFPKKVRNYCQKHYTEAASETTRKTYFQDMQDLFESAKGKWEQDQLNLAVTQSLQESELQREKRAL